MANASKEEIKKQKENLNRDLEIFREEVIKRIAHTDLKHDEFDYLGVFSNFFRLATETTPHLREEWESFKEKNDKIASNFNSLTEQATEIVNLVLQENDIAINLGHKDIDIIVDGKVIYSEYHENGPSKRPQYIYKYLHNLLNKVEKLSKTEEVKLYNKLQQELEEPKRLFTNARNKSIQKKIDKLIKSSNSLQEYIKMQSHVEKVQNAVVTLEKDKELFDEINKLADELKKALDKGDKSPLKKSLDQKATIVLAMKYLNLYNANFDTLKMSPVGAQKQLDDLVTENTEYYSKRSLLHISKDLDKWIKVGEIASGIHEGWREDRKNKEGIYEPKWKKVSDAAFIKKVKAMEELPENIRIVDGVVEQDIANTTFNDLCIDYQLENFEAAEFVYNLTKNDNYTKAEAGIVGKKIHDEWLRRNPWAKDSDLGAEFEDLIYTEKVSDLIQYNAAKGVLNKKEDTSRII